MQIAPGETAVQSLVISAGTDGAKAAFIESAEKLKAEAEAAETENSLRQAATATETENTPEQIVEKDDGESNAQTPDVIAIPMVAEPENQSAQEPDIPDWQLDPVYIQSLLDRISELKADGSVDKNEIRRLSEELDAIFSKLRQKKE